ncbi:MAG: pyridoxamine 5'-phosphate oxidase family protein [Alphaproteobacteria bacterium]|nr:pyridoxamine 5'-phosphate oxidase family protein [Alphaproteobacteria bacterium]
MDHIDNIADLEAIYGAPMPTSLAKVADHLTPEYARWIKAARFCILSTIGPEGTDGTPRGDDGPVVAIQDARTLLLPDWAGNNRNDSLRNIIRDSRLSLLFMVQGSNNVVRVNGRGKITTDEGLRAQFERKGMLPRTVLVVTLDEVYFQCAKALLRADLWGEVPDNPGLPTAGDFLKAMTQGREGGAEYDAGYEARAKRQLWVR